MFPATLRRYSLFVVITAPALFCVQPAHAQSAHSVWPRPPWFAAGNWGDSKAPETDNPVGAELRLGRGTTRFAEPLHNDGVIYTPRGARSLFSDLRGAGSHTGPGRVQIAGTHAPGNSPAIVVFQGDVYYGVGSTLQIELGDTGAPGGPFVPGVDHDQVEAQRGINLAGGLELVLFGGYTPQAGDSFVIINKTSAGPVGGAFSQLNGNGVPLPESATFTFAGIDWQISYAAQDGNNVVITAIPEPATVVVLGAVGVVALLRRRWLRRYALPVNRSPQTPSQDIS